MYIMLSMLVALFIALISYLKWCRSYWARKNIPYIEPKLILGNFENLFNRTKSIGETIEELYNTFKRRGEMHAGLYTMSGPIYLPLDLELIKNIMAKDFSNFHSRGIYYNEKDDPLGAHLLAIGGPKWKKIRSKLSPVFTSGKIKMMFNILVECAKSFEEYLKKIKKEEIDTKEVLGRFTTDIIGSCAFGLECNALNEEDCPFRKHGNSLFVMNKYIVFIKQFLMQFPNFARTIGLSFTPRKTTKFFMHIVKETLEYRHKNKITRNDFLQLLCDTEGLSFEDIAANCYVFFVAGFETSSSAMAFALYELAVHQDLQEKVRNEFTEVLGKYNGQITYEGLKELTYMEQVLEETLRIYPPASFVTRVAENDYKIPGTKFVIDKGTKCFIPIAAIQHDEEYYQEPSKFDPDRFTHENKRSRHQYAYIPFGEGPRICIGALFGIMQSKIGLLCVLKQYRLTVSKKMRQPLKISPTSFLTAAEGGIWLDAHEL